MLRSYFHNKLFFTVRLVKTSTNLRPNTALPASTKVPARMISIRAPALPTSTRVQAHTRVQAQVLISPQVNILVPVTKRAAARVLETRRDHGKTRAHTKTTRSPSKLTYF